MLAKNALYKVVETKLLNNLNEDFLPSKFAGIKIKIAGRLMNYKSKPRKTIKKSNLGIYSNGKINFKDFARYTNKNKKGSFSITISSGQNFFN